MIKADALVYLKGKKVTRKGNYNEKKLNELGLSLIIKCCMNGLIGCSNPQTLVCVRIS